MTSPIEAMAKAYEREQSRWHWDFSAGQREIKIIRAGDDAKEIIHRCSSQGYISSDQIDMLLESFQQPASARAALLALADCEIPADIPARAWSMHEANFPEGIVIDVNAMMVAEFRAMLRSIATGG